MRIVVVAPPRTGNLWLKCLLGRAYGLTPLLPGAAPARGSVASVRAWAAAGGFPDNTILHLHYNYSPGLAAALKEVPAHLVTIARDPHDMLVSIHRAAQRPPPRPDRQQSPSASLLAGKALDDPAVVDYIATDFRTQLQKADAWVQSGSATVVRFEVLRADPKAVLESLMVSLGPAQPERLDRAISSCRSTDAAADPSFHDEVGDATRRELRHRFSTLVRRLGYEPLRPSDITEEEIAEEAVTEEPSSPMGEDDLLPPVEQMRFRYARTVGREGFVRIGQRLVDRFVKECDLRPDEDVLDIGSGVGRVAIGLTHFLTPDARYEGFDVDGEGIAWCQQNLTPRFPNFGFQVADVHNTQYHPEGSQPASAYRFPYDDESFDFAFLISVFTHMLPLDLEQYLREIRRVLRPGGRCAATMFVLSDAARADIERGASSRLFPYDQGVYRVQDEEFPEHAVAFDEAYLLRTFATCGMPIREPLRPGGWSRRKENGHGEQDFVVALRDPAPGAVDAPGRPEHVSVP